MSRRRSGQEHRHSPAFWGVLVWGCDLAALILLTAIFWVPVVAMVVVGTSIPVIVPAIVVGFLLTALPFIAIVLIHPQPPQLHPQPAQRQGHVLLGHGFLDVLGLGYFHGRPVLPVPPLADTRPRPVQPRRNEPCPCGSGERFKFCHGRPGWRHWLWIVLGRGVRWLHHSRSRRR